MDKAVIIEMVKQVIAELRANAPQKKVLALFSGASTGFVAGMDAIKMMTDRGHQVTVVFSPSAVKIITEAHVRKAGATDIILPNTWVDTPALSQKTDLVLVPTLSMNTATRLAMGLMDTLMSTLIMGSLLAGKPVLAIRDGADPHGKGGQVFGAKPGVATGLKDYMAQNLDKLTSFGIELIDEPDFITTVDARLLGFNLQPTRKSPPASPAANPVPVSLPAQPGGTTFITHTDLLTLAPNSSICVPPGARFTPLAQDTVKQLKLNIVIK